MAAAAGRQGFQFMNGAPWEVLGVNPACSQDELKRAYARLLKQHRPDRDPEGFRRVRDAYEWMRSNADFCATFAADIAAQSAESVRADALQQDDSVAQVSTESESGSATEPVVVPCAQAGGVDESAAAADGMGPAADVATINAQRGAPETSRTYRKRWSLLRRIHYKLRTARRSKKKKVRRQALRLLVKHWRARKKQSDAWDRLMVRELFRKKSPLLKMLKPADAACDIRREGAMVAREMLRAYARIAAWPSVLNILLDIEAELKKQPSPQAAMVLVFGARLIALLQWTRAQQLTDLAYPHLPVQMRHHGLGDLDRMIQAGKELAMMNVQDRSTLSRCMASETADPKEDAVVRAFRNLSFSFSAPAARTVLAEQFPAFKMKLQVRPTHEVTTTREKAPEQSSSFLGNFWWVGIVLFMLSRAATNCGSSSSYSPPPVRYQPPPPQYSREELERRYGLKVEKDVNEYFERNKKNTTKEEPKLELFLDREKELPTTGNTEVQKILREIEARRSQKIKPKSGTDPTQTPLPLGLDPLQPEKPAGPSVVPIPPSDSKK